MPFRPIGDLIAVKLDPVQSEITSSIIAIPESAQPKATTGTVVALGSGIVLNSNQLKAWNPAVSIGDRIIVGKGSGQEVKVDDEQLLLIHEGDIMAVLG